MVCCLLFIYCVIETWAGHEVSVTWVVKLVIKTEESNKHRLTFSNPTNLHRFIHRPQSNVNIVPKEEMEEEQCPDLPSWWIVCAWRHSDCEQLSTGDPDSCDCSCTWKYQSHPQYRSHRCRQLQSSTSRWLPSPCAIRSGLSPGKNQSETLSELGAMILYHPFILHHTDLLLARMHPWSHGRDIARSILMPALDWMAVADSLITAWSVRCTMPHIAVAIALGIDYIACRASWSYTNTIRCTGLRYVCSLTLYS